MVFEMFPFLRSVIASVVMATCATVQGGMHPFHMSTAELELNPKSGKLEVALKIHGDDLQRALTPLAGGKRVSISDDSKTNALIRSYLNSHFVVVAQEADLKAIESVEAAGSAGKLDPAERSPLLSSCKVLGNEFRDNWLWVYFEIELPELNEEPVLLNSLLLDVTEGQINVVQLRNRNGRTALRTTASKRTVTFPPKWLSKELAIDPQVSPLQAP